MTSKARLTSKGQLTIPVAVRRTLGLRRGDTVAIEVTADGAVLRKAVRARDLRGSVPAKKVPWKSARRAGWRARAERLARSSATRTS